MPTIVLTPADAKYIADGCLAATSKEDVTPVICAAHITADVDGNVTAVATDRYRVHRVFATSTAQHKEPFDVVLGNEALKWISANARRYIKGWPDPIVVIDVDERVGNPIPLVTITVQETSSGEGRHLTLVDYGVVGTYPPVERLFNEAVGGELRDSVGIRVEYVGDLGKLVRTKGKAVRMYGHREGTTVGGKTAPVRFQVYGYEGKVVADALIAPNFLDR